VMRVPGRLASRDRSSAWSTPGWSRPHAGARSPSIQLSIPPRAALASRRGCGEEGFQGAPLFSPVVASIADVHGAGRDMKTRM